MTLFAIHMFGVLVAGSWVTHTVETTDDESIRLLDNLEPLQLFNLIIVVSLCSWLAVAVSIYYELYKYFKS